MHFKIPIYISYIITLLVFTSRANILYSFCVIEHARRQVELFTLSEYCKFHLSSEEASSAQARTRQICLKPK